MSYFGMKDVILEIAKGNVPKHGLITKFGFNSDVDTGTVPEDIWGGSSIYVPPTTARIHNFASTSASDTSAGVGARTIFIRGINGSYAKTSETITLNGTSNVATVNSYLHIHLAQVQTVGSTGVNVGQISATAVTDATVTIYVLAGRGQSTHSVYLVPDGYKGYIMRIRGRMNNATANSSATVGLYTRPFGLSLQLKTQMGVNNSGSSMVELDYTGSSPFIIPSKCWIILRCTAVTNNNTEIEAEYDLIEVQN
jgi:hypothetical protein